MDFFTRCCKRLPCEAEAVRPCAPRRGVPRGRWGVVLGRLTASVRQGVVWLLLAVLAVLPFHALADSVLAELASFELEHNDEGLFLSTTVKFELPSVVEDVLHKGIPAFFVAEAELRRDRWYWYDKRTNVVARHMRLAFQPLLRRWRLQVSANPIGNNGLGVMLSQNFDSLPDALAAVQRFSRWKIADASALEPDGRYNVDFLFRLDVSQLPRPFQIGALGQSEWTLAVSRNQKVGEVTR